MNIEQQAEEYSNNTYRQVFDEEWSIKECLKEAYIAGYNQCLNDLQQKNLLLTELDRKAHDIIKEAAEIVKNKDNEI